jgi:hypothetical protein
VWQRYPAQTSGRLAAKDLVPSVSNAWLHWDGGTWSLALLALRYIVEVLDGDDLRDSLRLRELLGSDVAQTDVTRGAEAPPLRLSISYCRLLPPRKIAKSF